MNLFNGVVVVHILLNLESSGAPEPYGIWPKECYLYRSITQNKSGRVPLDTGVYLGYVRHHHQHRRGTSQFRPHADIYSIVQKCVK